MNSKEISQGIILSIFKLGLIFICIWLLIQLKSLIIYIVISVVISLIGRPINRFLLNKLKLGKIFSSTLTIIILLSFFFLIISLFVPLLLQQSDNLSLLDVDEMKLKIEQLASEANAYFGLYNEFWVSQFSIQGIFNNFNFTIIPEVLNEFIEILGGFTIGLFSVVFISFFLLKDNKLLRKIILNIVTDNISQKVSKSITKIKELLSRYFIGILLQITILLIIYSIVLLIFGIKNAFIIAFLCALLNLIPYIGPIIGGFLMLILTMTSNIDLDFSSEILPKTIYVMIGFIIGQLIDNFFSQPYIFSKSVKSHPLEIFLVIIASGTLFGALGMIIAIPIYTSAKVILKEFFSESKIVKSLTKDI